MGLDGGVYSTILQPSPWTTFEQQPTRAALGGLFSHACLLPLRRGPGPLFGATIISTLEPASVRASLHIWSAVHRERERERETVCVFVCLLQSFRMRASQRHLLNASGYNQHASSLKRCMAVSSSIRGTWDVQSRSERLEHAIWV